MRKLIGLTIVVIFYNVLSTNAMDYCAYSDETTICKYMEDKLGPDCEPDTEIIYLTDEEKRFILKEHNRYRSKIANGVYAKDGLPQAARMKKLVWDDELAKIAHRWAMQCVFERDDLQNLPGYSWVGQNWYHIQATGAYLSHLDAIKESLEGWFAEIHNMTISSDFTYTINDNARRFVQLAWGDTKRIGCAIQNYQQDDHYHSTTTFYCNYFPGGNVVGWPLYEVGYTCSKCNKDDTCTNGLCVNS